SVIRNGARKAISIRSVLLDVTDRRLAEQLLANEVTERERLTVARRRSKEVAEKANWAKSEQVANLALWLSSFAVAQVNAAAISVRGAQSGRGQTNSSARGVPAWAVVASRSSLRFVPRCPPARRTSRRPPARGHARPKHPAISHVDQSAE